MSKISDSDGKTVDIPPNPNQSTPLGKTEKPGTLKHLLDKLQKFLKGNLKALGVAQIMIGVKCIFYGIIGFFAFDSEMYPTVFFSIYTGFPLWGALSFIMSGSLTVVSAKKQTKSLTQTGWISLDFRILIPISRHYKKRKNIGANTLSTLVSIVGICILSYNLTKNFRYDCKKETLCLGIKSIAIGLVIVLMILTCLQILISLPLSMLIYNVDDRNIHWISVFFCWKSPSESPYQDLLPQTSIYQELECKEETPSCYPTDTSKQI
ncbi:high affinity immunoglobulin epsilon receptor subunit beta isoform X2 [Prionailurus iriomotensis]